MAHVYTFLFWQPVTSSFPSAERAAQRTLFSCWRGGPTGRLVSRFHRRAVLSSDALARRCSFRDRVMA
jgi:hypothetical protein